MKSIFGIITIFLTCHSLLYGQKNNANKLPTYLSELSQEYGVEFAYDQNSLNEISIEGKNNASLENTILALCNENKLECIKLSDTYYLIRKKYANQGGKIEITIYDRNDFTPIPNVEIIDNSSKVIAISDVDGLVMLSDDQIIETSNYFINNALFNPITFAGKDLKNSNIIALTSRYFVIDPIEIHSKKNLEISNSLNGVMTFNNLNSTELGNLMGSDALRKLQYLPGISAHNDNESGIAIRGHESDETLIILDELPILNANHYFGIFSNIDAYYIQKAEVYKTVLPLKYGGKTGGLVSLTSIPAKDKPSALLDLNLLSSTLQASIPNQNHNLAINFRKTLFNIGSQIENSSGFMPPDVENLEVNELNEVNVESSPEFSFQDLNIKYDYQFNFNHKINVNYFSSKDLYYSNIFFQNNVNLGDMPMNSLHEFGEESEWDNDAYGLNYYYSNNHYQSQYSLSQSSYKNELQQEGSTTLLLPLGDSMVINQINNEIGNGIKLTNFISHHELKQEKDDIQFGLNIQNFESELTVSEEDSIITSQLNHASIFTLYGGIAHHFSKKLDFDLGIRSSFYSENHNLYFSPRASMNYRPSMRSSYRASISYYNQFINTLNFEQRLGQDIELYLISDGYNVPIQNALKTMLGMKHIIDDFVIDIEFYYETLRNISQVVKTKNEFQEGEVGIPQIGNYKFVRGSGRYYGMDLSISKEWSNFKSFLSYSLSKNLVSFKEIANGEYHPSASDRRHQLKWLNSYTYHGFQLDYTFVYTSGKRYLDQRVLLSPKDREEEHFKNQYRYLPDYIRNDLGVSYEFNWLEKPLKIYFCVFNVFDRLNVKYRQQLFKLPVENHQFVSVGTDVPLLERTFNLGIKLQL
ncbi:MAG: TonB-dependent receptor plug domain-containing protein [Lewinellaceae bacterium]|nr:TonB-dependent receptor plug domain-containing protein [Lewinellaceae bacterium]